MRVVWNANLTSILKNVTTLILTKTICMLQIAKITEEGVTISEPYSLKTFWKFSAFHDPAKGAEGSWQLDIPKLFMATALQNMMHNVCETFLWDG